ncbi:MAG: nucleotidyltransferase family protein [Thermodesulfobacteriota bacterium]|nr:nucleotidyltransferase family protein [Thermodesulfobacteriota bacterium]
MKLGSLIREQRENILKIAKAHGATNLKIFGSYARGDEQAGSDIDLLIELEPGRSLLDIIAIKQDIEDMINRRVDVVTAGALSPYIREEIVKEAIAL